MIRKATAGNNVWAATFGLYDNASGISFGIRGRWVDTQDSPVCDYAIGSIEYRHSGMQLILNKELIEKFGIELLFMDDMDFRTEP